VSPPGTFLSSRTVLGRDLRPRWFRYFEGGEPGTERAQLQALSADGLGRDVNDLTGVGMSAFSGNADPSGKSRNALHLDGPACSRRRIDGVRREADHHIVKGSLVESVLAQTDREFFAIDVVLDGQDRGQRADRQGDSTERSVAEKIPARRGRDRGFVEMFHGPIFL
jgi:hypothetical protein